MIFEKSAFIISLHLRFHQSGFVVNTKNICQCFAQLFRVVADQASLNAVGNGFA